MSKRDYYEVLGVSQGATDKEVKKAYIKNNKITDFRTAAYLVAIEKIALAYDSIGL